jgi:hypothetical protein
MILIVSHEKDGHSRRVMEMLDRKGHPYKLFDLTCFPASAALSISYEKEKYISTLLERENDTLDMSEFGSVWWRRPQGFTLHDDMRGEVERSFSYTECQCAVAGMWLLEPTKWINNPVNDEVANRKVYQLRVATDCGLQIPETLVTSNPIKAKEFVEKLKIGNVIYKSFSATRQAWRETRLVKEGELEKMEAVKYAPVIFQECIHADIDLRITVIGDKVFPAAIHSQNTSYKVDYRMNYHEATIEPHELPRSISSKLLLLMKKLGLVYGAIDMRRNSQGEYIFLEINTAGQWLFMEEPTGMPITEALSDKLIEFDTKEVLQPA